MNDSSTSSVPRTRGARTCLRCITVFLAAVGIFLLAVAFGFVFRVVDWLANPDAEAPADAIVVLAGAPERALYAADLHARGLAKRVLVSRPARNPRSVLLDRFGVNIPAEEAINRRILEQKGVPADHVDYFGSASLSTVQEMEALEALFRDRRTRLLVVTSPLHVRRARLIARRVLPADRFEVAVVATSYETVPRQWWRDQESARNILLETAKTLFFLVGGRYRAGT